VELLVLHWPIAVGLVAAAAIPRGHRWLVLAGAAGGALMIGYALAFASDEAEGFLVVLSDQDLYIFLAVYWVASWLVGVAAGILLGRALRRTRHPGNGPSSARSRTMRHGP
jgi:hypothetical protein